MSRNQAAYMSASNMSDIKQSIEEYSMNFQNSNQAISQLISVSRTGHNATISKGAKNPAKKSFVKIVEQYQKPQTIHKTQKSIIEEVQDKQNTSFIKQNKNRNNESVNLGQHVFKYVKQRFSQVNGTQTCNPEVLFQFYSRQRKNFDPSKSVTGNIKFNDIGVLMPSSQRKLFLKIQFEKVLTYYPNDVYYTLVCGAEKYKIDKNNENKVQRLKHQLAKSHHKEKKDISKIVDRLYATKKSSSIHQGAFSQIKMSEIEPIVPKIIEQRQKRKIFVVTLRQHYKRHCQQKNIQHIQSAKNLHKFWQDVQWRNQLNIEWSEQTVLNDIKIYMLETIEDLLFFLQKKLGFRQLKENQLKKFYLQYVPIEGLDIPIDSFKQYIYEYNQIMKQKQKQQHQRSQKHLKEQQQRRKKQQLKKFGRPVSATPISVLSKPKTSTSNYGGLIDKYQKDKFLNSILHEDKMKVARRAFEYGIYNLEEQVKTKCRVKPKSKQKFDQTVQNLLNKTFTNPNFYINKDQDRLNEIFDEEGLYKSQTWKLLKPILQEALLVKCFEEQWIREALLKYCSKISKKDLKYSDDKTIVQEIFQYFDSNSQTDRQRSLISLKNTIDLSKQIDSRNKAMEKLNHKGQNANLQQKRMVYNILQQKACEYIKMRIERKEINVRKFLNEMFESLMQKYKQFVIKHFNVVQGDKQCPKLLKYQFFRLQKEINPLTQQRDEKSKCHAWIPTKCQPQSFNYKTFNTYSNVYKVDRNKIVSKPQRDTYKKTIWSQNKDRIKQRQVLLMSYEDAKQCVFHPKISVDP